MNPMLRLSTLRLSTATSLALLLAVAGCSLADASRYQALPEGPGVDGGTVDADGATPDPDSGMDAGPPDQLAVDGCGDDDVYVITDSEEGIRVDTRPFGSDVNSLPGSCGVSTPGNDAFFAVDVQAGEYWHFHLATASDDPDRVNRNPMVYLLNASCAETQCSRNLFADYCDQQQDEHFGFQFNESGRWYIGIDDGNAGGGVYTLGAYRPTCNGTAPAEHGESCDGEEGCTEDCRRVINEESVAEAGFSFNVQEANLIELPASNALTFEGDVGGFEGCAYPDVFAIDVPAGANLVLEEMGCTNGAGAASIRVAIQSRTGMVRAASDPTADGCAGVSSTFATEGRFFIVVTDARVDTRIPYAYRIHVSY
jgi:hypothetical protein